MNAPESNSSFLTFPPVNQAVVCLSGGMDSTSLLLHLLAKGCQVYGLSFDYGQKHKVELDRLNANLQYLADAGYPVSHQVVDLSKLGQLFHSALTDSNWDVPHGYYEEENMKQTVVPNRNAIFSSVSYGYALSVANRMLTRDLESTNDGSNAVDSQADYGVASAEPNVSTEKPEVTDWSQSNSTEESIRVVLALGVHQGDHAIYPDCRPAFYQQLVKAFEVGNWDSQRVRLYLPYLEGDKVTILKDAAVSIDKLGLDFERIFQNTLTSYEPDEAGRSHGETGSDVERILAFNKLGLRDPAPYVRPWEEVLERALEIERDAGN